jgi:hypothetical protein
MQFVAAGILGNKTSEQIECKEGDLPVVVTKSGVDGVDEELEKLLVERFNCGCQKQKDKAKWHRRFAEKGYELWPGNREETTNKECCSPLDRPGPRMRQELKEEAAVLKESWHVKRLVVKAVDNAVKCKLSDDRIDLRCDYLEKAWNRGRVLVGRQEESGGFLNAATRLFTKQVEALDECVRGRLAHSDDRCIQF